MTERDRSDCKHLPPAEPRPQQNPPRRIDRRALLKATAAFVAMTTAAPNLISRQSSAEEESTRAGEWRQPDSIGGTGEHLDFQSEFPFNAVAPHWPGDTAFAGAVVVQLSDDGQTWSDPVTVGPAHTDAGPPDREGRNFGELVFTEEANFVRYSTVDANGNQATIAGLSFTYIDAKAGPSIQHVTASSPSPSLTRPPIISREQWGAARAYGGADRAEVLWPPEYQTVKHVIIHHSETPRFRDPFVEIRSIHYYHAITRGWGDIGYNYLVDYMGNVYEGRVGGENAIGGHAFQYARGSAGICTMGSYTVQHATPEAVAGLSWITAWAARKLDPTARRDFHETPNLPTICGHRDVVNSTCPGDGLYADLPTIRWAVADVIAGAREVINDPAYSPGQTIQTTVNDANLRTGPGPRQSVVATLQHGSVLHIVDGPTTEGGYTWYKVRGNRGTGWLASSIFRASDAEPPTGEFSVGDKLEVDTDFLNIRSKASIRAAANATIPRGTAATVLDGPNPAGGFRWYRLDTAYGKGWAVEQYLIPKGTAQPVTRFLVGDAVLVKDRDGVRLRSAPGLGTGVVRSLPFGTTGVVVGNARVSDAITWLEVQTSLGTGWTAEPYLKAAPTGPWTDPIFERGDAVKVNTDSVNLRRTPGTSGTVIRTLGNGIVGTVTEPSSAANNMWWVRIDTDYGTGWVAEAFLAGAGAGTSREFDIGDNVYIDTDGINIRTAPGVSSKVVTIVYQNNTAKVVDGPRTADGYVWYKLQTKSNTGWGVSRYLALGSADPGGGGSIKLGDVVAVDTDGIKLRESPGLSGKWVKTIYTNTKATVIEGPRKVDGYTWVRLQAGANRGWGVAGYLKVTTGDGIAAGQTARTFDGDLNLRSAAGTGNSVLAVLPDGTYVDVIAGPTTVDGNRWVKVRSSRYGSGWCVAKFLAIT